MTDDLLDPRLFSDPDEEPDIEDLLFAEVPLTDPADIPPDGDDSVHAASINLDDMVVATPEQIAALTASGHINPSHLHTRERIRARDLGIQAMALVLHNAGSVHYTQGANRWEGINRRDRAWRGQYPKHGDCSSTDDWALWCALTHFKRFVHVDIVNGLGWRAGYTGSMTPHGVSVRGHTLQRMDQVFYGRSRSVPSHVATYIGGGLVISHGSEAGPFKLSMRYRHDLVDVRRYI